MSSKSLAKEIIAYYEFKGSPDPKCRTCLGKGEYEDSDYHSDYTTACDCVERNRPRKPSLWGDDLVALAKYRLRKK
jgi:hypothetical protein